MSFEQQAAEGTEQLASDRKTHNPFLLELQWPGTLKNTTLTSLEDSSVQAAWGSEFKLSLHDHSVLSMASLVQLNSISSLQKNRQEQAQTALSSSQHTSAAKFPQQHLKVQITMK